MIRRKYELKQKHVYKLCLQIIEKIVVNNLKIIMKNTIVDGILIENMNWNTLMRLIVINKTQVNL